MNNALVDFYRCPEGFGTFSSPKELKPQPGYFGFGPGTVCYGRSAVNSPAKVNGAPLADLVELTVSGATLQLPFNASTIVDNLRLERYPVNGHDGPGSVLSSEQLRRVYYSVRPMLPASFRKVLQRFYLRGWDKLAFPAWPVDTSVEQTLEKILLLSMRTGKVNRVPFIWFWPNGAPSSAIVTHDVETNVGLDFLPRLMDVDDAFGVKSSFQLVPEERYKVSKSLLRMIRSRLCDINVHGLNHDGNLFRDRTTFLRHAKLINRYIVDYGAEGFRSACMYRNVDWYQDLDISYDMSVPNVAHLEPQRGGCCTIFPYFIGKILELPLTTIQDYSLFNILGDYSIDLWKKQIDLIEQKHGLISFIAHPDYLVDPKALSVYQALLAYLSRLRSEKKVWIARPSEVNCWWRQRSSMTLVLSDGEWRIEGPGRDRARIGFASIKNDSIEFSVEKSYVAPAGAESWSDSLSNCIQPIGKTS